MSERHSRNGTRKQGRNGHEPPAHLDDVGPLDSYTDWIRDAVPADQIAEASATRWQNDRKSPTGRSQFDPAQLLTSTISYNANSSYLIKNVLIEGGIHLWFGPPGTCKTALGMRAGAELAAGHASRARMADATKFYLWGQRAPRRCNVVHLFGEGFRSASNRWLALPKDLRDRASGHYAVIPMTGVALYGEQAAQGIADIVSTVKAAIAAMDPDEERATIIIVDTMAVYSGLESENDNSQVSTVVKNLKLISAACGDAAIIAIHHTTKAGNTPRGAGAWSGDTDICLQFLPDDENERTLVYMTKGKDSSLNYQTVGAFTRSGVEIGTDRYGEVETAVVVDLKECDPDAHESVAIAAKAKTQKPETQADVYLRAYDQVAMEQGDNGLRLTGQPKGAIAVKISEVDARCVTLLKEAGHSNPNLRCIRRRLVTDKALLATSKEQPATYIWRVKS